MTRKIERLPHKIIFRSALIVGIVMSATARAAVVTFDDESAFLASAGDVTVENFNSFTTQQSFDTGSITLDDFTLSTTGPVVGGDNNYIGPTLPGSLALSNFDDTPIVWARSAGAGNVAADPVDVVFSFDDPTMVFGAWYLDLNNAGLTDITLSDGTVVDPPVSNAIGFFGFVSDTAFSSVIFRTSVANDGFGVDNVTYSSNLAPVPLPAAIWIFGSGLIGLIAIARRKKA